MYADQSTYNNLDHASLSHLTNSSSGCCVRTQNADLAFSLLNFHKADWNIGYWTSSQTDPSQFGLPGTPLPLY